MLLLEKGVSLANGKYFLSAKLGEGGMASVWAATCTTPDNLPDEIVLKVLLPEIRKDEEKRRFFLEEAKLSTTLDHQYIVKVFKVEQWNDLDILVMERIWGHSLDELIKQTYQTHETAIPWPLALRMTAMIAEALDYANNARDRHGQPLNVIHRDIKPGNVLFTADGHVKVIDFGIAKASTSQIKTQTGMVKGTIAYMSPEQLRGEKLDIRSDLFSLGILLFELCTGHRPFYGENFTAMMFNILTKPPLDPSNFRSNLPREICDLILSMIAKDRKDRPKDGKDLLAQLSALLAQEPQEGSLKALKDYFAEQYPELLQERSETAKLMGKTDPESLLSESDKDALAAQAEAFRGGTLGLDAIGSELPEHLLPTGEVVKGVSSAMRAMSDPNAAHPTQQFNNTPDPFPASHKLAGNADLPRTSDALRAQDVPTTDLARDELPSRPNRLPYILSLLILLLGGAAAAFFLTRSTTKSGNNVPSGNDKAQTRLTPKAAQKQPKAVQKRSTPTGNAPQAKAPTPIPAARQPAPTPRAKRIAPRPRARKRRRRRRIYRPRRRIRPRVRPRRAAAPATGQTQIIASPPCVVFYKGRRIGATNQKAVLTAPTGRHSFRCDSPVHLFSNYLTASVVAGTVLKRPFRFQRGTIRVLANHWGKVFIFHRRFGDKKLGLTNQKFRLYEGQYKIVVRHGTRIGAKKTFTVRIRPHRITTLKVLW